MIEPTVPGQLNHPAKSPHWIERPGGIYDTTPPQLLSLKISPTLINVRSEAQMFETSVHVTDDFSGVAFVSIKVSGRLGSDETTLMRAASMETGSRHDG